MNLKNSLPLVVALTLSEFFKEINAKKDSSLRSSHLTEDGGVNLSAGDSRGFRRARSRESGRLRNRGVN